MFEPPEVRRPLLPAQFALRVAVLGGAALVMFSIIFFRLWYLQVLSSDKYLDAAHNQRIRQVTVQAPRGSILDREGVPLVENRTALELQVIPIDLPRRHDRRREVISRLGEAAGLSPARIRNEIRRQTEELPASPVTLSRDVPYELAYFLRENQGDFPGVAVARVFVRRYPEGTLGAHLFGYVREVSAEQLEEPRYEDLVPGDEVGVTGVESTYDHLLRGLSGAARIQVDATGQPTGGRISEREPRAGNDLYLTIDAEVQRAGEQAISSFGLPGAFVAMDVDDGQIYGLGSLPTFDPSIFGRPVVTQATFDALTDPDNGNALANRAIQGLYPTGSTFKPITDLAALDAGLVEPETLIYDGGSIRVGDITFQNAGGAAYGSIAMREALQVSSDVYHYILGQNAYNAGGETREIIQEWATDLGLGSATGIDLPAELAGLVPTPEWRNDLYARSQDPDSPAGEEVVPEDVYEYGGADRPWSVGDNVNLSVGQGDLQADPLQMAVAYATIANGGEVVRPHVALRAEDSSGRVIQEIDPAPRREVEIEPEWRDTIMDGLHAAATQPGGTSYAIFGGFPIPVAGKTGTAERPGYADQSWYVALAPAGDPKVVVAVTIEQGGFGAESAAPAARQILQAYFEVKDRTVEDVASSAGSYD
jgi:penicillin-binding protein 2